MPALETNMYVPHLSTVRRHDLLPTGNVQIGTGVNAVEQSPQEINKMQ
jgi:hypothetical protein